MAIWCAIGYENAENKIFRIGKISEDMPLGTHRNGACGLNGFAGVVYGYSKDDVRRKITEKYLSAKIIAMNAV